jgi:hypothetical protein
MSLAIGLTFILIWVIGFPVLIFIILMKNKHKLNDPDFIVQYGLFFVGLTDEAFFWEIIVTNCRKIIFVICSTLLSSQNPLFKVRI